MAQEKTQETSTYSKELVEFAKSCPQNSVIYIDNEQRWYSTATKFQLGSNGKHYGEGAVLPEGVTLEKEIFAVNEGIEVKELKVKDIK